jgi:hypothetical protein
MAEQLTLKWGTLKGWKLDEDGPAFAAIKRYHEDGVALGAAQQRDTAAQKQAICDIIDALDADTVYLDWDGKHVSKDEAKKYVLGYSK